MTGPQNPLDLTVVLSWITMGGAVWLAGKAFSYLADNWAKWNDLPKQVKVLAPLVFSIVLSVAATVMLQYSNLLATIQPWYALIIQTLIIYASTQATYYSSVRPVRVERNKGC